MVTNRKWQQSRRANPNYPSTNPVDITGKPITNEANLHRFGKAIAYTRENMQYYTESFPHWDRNFLIGRVRQVFFWIQDAWARQDLNEGENYLAASILEKYRLDLTNQKSRGERNVIKEPVLHPEDIEFIYSHLDELNQQIIVMIRASMIDYTVDTSGQIIVGDEEKRLYIARSVAL